MEKANVIISIIIVLCIATAVAAYGIINNPNAIFSDLASMNSGSGNGGNGIGNNTTHTNPASSGTGSGSGSSSGSGSGSGSGGSGGGSGGGGSGGGSGGGGSGGGTVHTSAQIRAIAMDHVSMSGCYAGTPSYSNGYWTVTIYNSTDNSAVDGMVINDRTGEVSRG